jgi:hypothetical protein
MSMTIADFEAEIADLDESQESKNLLLYGNSGVGKSHIAGKLPRGLVLAFEPGWETIRRVSKANNNPMKFIQVNHPDKLDAAIRYLEQGGYADYDWVIPDGLSTLQVKSTLAYAAAAHNANPAKRVSRQIPDRADYFNAQNLIKDFVARLIDLPVSTLWTAHAMLVERADGTEEIWPQIEGKETRISNYVAGLMNAVGYMTVKEREGREVRQICWRTSTYKDVTVIAKDQFSALPPVHKNPTTESILSAIDGGSSEDTSSVPEIKSPRRAGSN